MQPAADNNPNQTEITKTEILDGVELSLRKPEGNPATFTDPVYHEAIREQLGVDPASVGSAGQLLLAKLISREGDTSNGPILISDEQGIRDLRMAGFEINETRIVSKSDSTTEVPDFFEQRKGAENPLDDLYDVALAEAGNHGAQYVSWEGPAYNTNDGYAVAIRIYRIAALPESGASGADLNTSF